MKKKDFDNVFRKGKSRAGKLVFLKILRNNLGVNRFGVIVSTKISKKAVIRNKIRRRIREIARKANFEKGFDIVVLVRPEIVNKTYQEIKNDIENLLQNI